MQGQTSTDHLCLLRGGKCIKHFNTLTELIALANKSRNFRAKRRLFPCRFYLRGEMMHRTNDLVLIRIMNQGNLKKTDALYLWKRRSDAPLHKNTAGIRAGLF